MKESHLCFHMMQQQPLCSHTQHHTNSSQLHNRNEYIGIINSVSPFTTSLVLLQRLLPSASCLIRQTHLQCKAFFYFGSSTKFQVLLDNRETASHHALQVFTCLVCLLCRLFIALRFTTICQQEIIITNTYFVVLEIQPLSVVVLVLGSP